MAASTWDQREAYLNTVARLLAPGGWLLGLFWYHRRPDSTSSSGKRRRVQPPGATTNGWGSGGADHLNQQTLHPKAVGAGLMRFSNERLCA